MSAGEVIQLRQAIEAAERRADVIKDWALQEIARLEQRLAQLEAQKAKSPR